MRERNDNACSHVVEITTGSTLSQLRRLGLYIEQFFTDIAHQTDEAESVVEYACAATNVQMYLVGEETEVVQIPLKKPRTPALVGCTRSTTKIPYDNQDGCLQRWNARRHRGEAP